LSGKKQKDPLKQIIQECGQHIYYLKYAHGQLITLFPIAANELKTFEPELVGHIDQMIFRFLRLQDAVGQKLFTRGLNALGEATESMSVIDKLRKIEKLGILGDANEWLMLRELRNEFAHDYPDEDENKAEALNELKLKIPYLIETFDAFVKYLKNSGVVGKD
jgi:uncharacterized protein with HEPN domain